MKTTRYAIPLFLCILFIINVSCTSSNEETTESREGIYELVKVDSFQVNNLTRINILDYSSEEKIFLGYSTSEDDLLEISETGEILKRTNRKGEGPNLYGNWNPIGLGFGPNGQRIVELPFAVFSYDKNYEVLQQFRIMSPLPIRANTPFGKPPYYQNSDTTFLLVGPSNYFTATYLIHNQEGKDTLQNFYQLNMQNGNVKSVIPYAENSIYNSTENIYPELMGKSFSVDHEKNELAVVQNLDTDILIYDLPGLTLNRTIPISHSEFLTYDPLPIGTPFSDERAITLNKLSARNQKLFSFGDNTYLLQYFTGISQAEYESRNSEEDPYVGQFDENEQRILIFKDGKQLTHELPGIKSSLKFTLPDNKILVQEPENSDIEEEFTRFSIYQLQKN
ncbi:hypothetical protein SAMN04489724_1407 [Algoriphagus locisalis]|uniref:TolB-like 6-blade propeller-like n=1 Tax=Algoriphagus locisalis TaxID=305507 RepID=A0A1I6ZQG1_9BACT|nr:hypothetical protein [Algoriphagus locisalis]SFT64949.1 hypothetical protein SAMN04489724_1407 [Algoriphagus locisalis]